MGDSIKPSVWIFGDQLNLNIKSLEDRSPDDCRVLMVESKQKISSKPWHAQRQHLIVSAMTHFATELKEAGYEVDYQFAHSHEHGLKMHLDNFSVEEVVAMEPSSWGARQMLERLNVRTVPNTQFLCTSEEFAAWSQTRKNIRMEDFYRWQRKRLNVLMDDMQPVGGRWNFDADNRKPPPKSAKPWPLLRSFPLDETDSEVLQRLPDAWGSAPDGTWPINRQQALERLEEFISEGLDEFGAYEDAMLKDQWKLSHSCLSSSMNLGLLHPSEVIGAVEDAYRSGNAPINSVEGYIRQILGWREYIWGLYWLWMPQYLTSNALKADQPVPPVFLGKAETEMLCVETAMTHLREHGYTHHIERLMVFGNLALTAGVEPRAMMEWMWASFVDGAEWVMAPNVIGMALYADGGAMSSKPYASGGAYLNRMSDSCGDCFFDPKKRVGDDACPYTTLYWDFLDRHSDFLRPNHRLSLQYGNLDRLTDLHQIRNRATEIRERLRKGQL